jgi:hypothetical protein
VLALPPFPVFGVALAFPKLPELPPVAYVTEEPLIELAVPFVAAAFV